ncbi:hypothetical protein ALC56_08510 [Trachymyrmex septentrionalis]|uniref:Uncharacterized protein n=1 Tax=Trachymyrmex septentrionalis TaxID=34720 RepID=A0A195F9J2_9HYME|nr:hypothetical protein ALC56_08510 [Trachymyrmex septentrionalis]
MAATQAKRFTSSVAGVASAPHFPPDVSPTSIQVTHAAHAFCEIFIINGNECFAIDRWIRCFVVCCGFIHQSSDIHFSSCPTSAMEGLPKYIVLPHVAAHTNVLSHSSTMQGRDTIPRTPHVSPPAVGSVGAVYERRLPRLVNSQGKIARPLRESPGTSFAKRELSLLQSGIPFREFRKTQEAIIPRRKNILLGHTEKNIRFHKLREIMNLAHNFSANEGNLEALDTSRLTYEGCNAAKLTEEQQTFVDSTTSYAGRSLNRFNRRLSSTYPYRRDRSRYRNDISWPAFAAADGGNMRVARGWRDKKVG